MHRSADRADHAAVGIVGLQRCRRRPHDSDRFGVENGARHRDRRLVRAQLGHGLEIGLPTAIVESPVAVNIFLCHSAGMGRHGNYRLLSFTAEDRENLLLALGEAHNRAVRYGGSLHFSDPRKSLIDDLRRAVDAIGAELTGKEGFFVGDTTTSSSGYMLLRMQVEARRKSG